MEDIRQWYRLVRFKNCDHFDAFRGCRIGGDKDKEIGDAEKNQNQNDLFLCTVHGHNLHYKYYYCKERDHTVI